ncbi:hypothetical protein BDQ12DRAFT_254009 [Crucibulum laeve]|uniref:DUF6534 domain-containing protein n=1 Tax=Crucibulum laeve TaxID=68775 RepID=A0A5C3LUI4_9AGAR|nr:hypothetical protein BDQ12DRAFT_254009 [Crucibulum laeve]
MAQSPNPHLFSGSLLIGCAISSAMYGTLCGQISWYFGRFSKDHIYMRGLVAFISLTETGHFISISAALWYNVIQRGQNMPWDKFTRCIPFAFHFARPLEEMTCFMVEGFFIRRMWIFAQQKRLAQFTILPFLLGWGFTIAYLVGMVRYPCYPAMARNRPILVISYGFRIVSDGLISWTMIYSLFKHSSGIGFTSSVRTIRGLAGWIITTGLLMWLSSIAFIVAQLCVGNTLIPAAIYMLRGRLYANAMLAQCVPYLYCSNISIYLGNHVG